MSSQGTDERKPTPTFTKDQYRTLADMLSDNAAKSDERVSSQRERSEASTRERQPGPPTSGEVGPYDAHIIAAPWTVGTYIWDGARWEHRGPEMSSKLLPAGSVVPLHDYPLVPGDAVRKLQMQLECALKLIDQARREALKAGFEAGRKQHYVWSPKLSKHVCVSQYDTFEDYMRVANPKEEDQ